MEYATENIKVRLKTTPLDYGEDCRPADPAIYRRIDERFAGRKIFDLWERIEPGGDSWLGVVDAGGERTVEGDFKTYLHTGPRDELMAIGQQIGRDHPTMKDFYFVYLNSPTTTAAEDLRTKIVFRA